MKTFCGFFLLALAVATFPATAGETPQTKVISTIAVDFDGDGLMDRADLVQINPEAGDASLNGGQDFMVGASERVDLVLTFNAVSNRPVFIKKQVVDPEAVFLVSALESKSKGSVSIHSCYGCGAMKSWDQTLTIAYRKGSFVVAGYSKSWEWYFHTSEGNVDGKQGECDINYLTGRGAASRSADEARPLKARFRMMKLSAWSDASVPKACNFY